MSLVQSKGINRFNDDSIRAYREATFNMTEEIRRLWSQDDHLELHSVTETSGFYDPSLPTYAFYYHRSLLANTALMYANALRAANGDKQINIIALIAGVASETVSSDTGRVIVNTGVSIDDSAGRLVSFYSDEGIPVDLIDHISSPHPPYSGTREALGALGTLTLAPFYLYPDLQSSWRYANIFQDAKHVSIPWTIPLLEPAKESAEEILDLSGNYDRIVLKPEYGERGNGIDILNRRSLTQDTLAKLLRKRANKYGAMVVQQYICPLSIDTEGTQWNARAIGFDGYHAGTIRYKASSDKELTAINFAQGAEDMYTPDFVRDRTLGDDVLLSISRAAEGADSRLATHNNGIAVPVGYDLIVDEDKRAWIIEANLGNFASLEVLGERYTPEMLGNVSSFLDALIKSVEAHAYQSQVEAGEDKYCILDPIGAAEAELFSIYIASYQGDYDRNALKQQVRELFGKLDDVCRLAKTGNEPAIGLLYSLIKLHSHGIPLNGAQIKKLRTYKNSLPMLGELKV
ncbi:MAG: YheC/YheD family protein [Patescibacteria group bacterium]